MKLNKSIIATAVVSAISFGATAADDLKIGSVDTSGEHVVITGNNGNQVDIIESGAGNPDYEVKFNSEQFGDVTISSNGEVINQDGDVVGNVTENRVDGTYTFTADGNRETVLKYDHDSGDLSLVNPPNTDLPRFGADMPELPAAPSNPIAGDAQVIVGDDGNYQVSKDGDVVAIFQPDQGVLVGKDGNKYGVDKDGNIFNTDNGVKVGTVDGTGEITLNPSPETPDFGTPDHPIAVLPDHPVEGKPELPLIPENPILPEGDDTIREGIDKVQGAINDRVDSVDGAIGDLNGRIDDAIAGGNGAIDDLNGKIDDIVAGGGDLNGKIDDAIANGNGKIDDTNGRIDDLNGKVDDAIANGNERVEKARDAIQAAAPVVKERADELREIYKQDMNDLGNAIAGNSGRLDDHEERIDSLEQSFKEQGRKLREMDDRLDQVMASSHAIANARPVLATAGEYAIGVGMGWAGSTEAIAIGGAYQINDQWSVSGTANYASSTTYASSDFSAGVGAHYRFGN